VDKSFQIIRTNPRLTTNVKLVVNSDNSIYLESFNSSKELSDQKYKHVLLNRESLIEDEMPRFYDGLPKKIAFAPKSEIDMDVMYDRYENQFDNTYYSGANEVEDQWYKEEFEYFAPLYIKKNNIPKKFMILRVDDAAIYELDGQDYVNDAPVIIVNDSASEVTDCLNNTDYNFHINISFDDTENDFKKVALYYKWNPKDDWQLEDNWFYQSNGDYCTVWKTIDYGYGPQILHWLVEVMDGYNLEYLEGKTTLYKPDCP